jgi:hypothetical protein
VPGFFPFGAEWRLAQTRARRTVTAAQSTIRLARVGTCQPGFKLCAGGVTGPPLRGGQEVMPAQAGA